MVQWQISSIYSFSMEIIVKAWLNGKMATAGKLHCSGSRIEFWYHQDFLECGYALDPINLPLNENIFETAHHLQGALIYPAHLFPVGDRWVVDDLYHRAVGVVAVEAARPVAVGAGFGAHSDAMILQEFEPVVDIFRIFLKKADMIETLCALIALMICQCLVQCQIVTA